MAVHGVRITKEAFLSSTSRYCVGSVEKNIYIDASPLCVYFHECSDESDAEEIVTPSCSNDNLYDYLLHMGQGAFIRDSVEFGVEANATVLFKEWEFIIKSREAVIDANAVLYVDWTNSGFRPPKVAEAAEIASKEVSRKAKKVEEQEKADQKTFEKYVLTLGFNKELLTPMELRARWSKPVHTGRDVCQLVWKDDNNNIKHMDFTLHLPVISSSTDALSFLLRQANSDTPLAFSAPFSSVHNVDAKKDGVCMMINDKEVNFCDKNAAANVAKIQACMKRITGIQHFRRS